jgi:hypothetical protein
MVDYHNPVMIAREFSAYVFPSGITTSSPIDRSVFSTAEIVNFWHVADGIFMYVSLPTAGSCRPGLQSLRACSIVAHHF